MLISSSPSVLILRHDDTNTGPIFISHCGASSWSVSANKRLGLRTFDQ